MGIGTDRVKAAIAAATAVELPNGTAGLVIGGRCYPIDGAHPHMVSKIAEVLRGNGTPADWELHGPNGVVMKLDDVQIARATDFNACVVIPGSSDYEAVDWTGPIVTYVSATIRSEQGDIVGGHRGTDGPRGPVPSGGSSSGR